MHSAPYPNVGRNRPLLLIPTMHALDSAGDAFWDLSGPKLQICHPP